MLKHGKIRDWRGGFAKIEKPGVTCEPDDFEILECGHETEANVLTDRIAAGEQDFRKIVVDDDYAGMLGIVVGSECSGREPM